MKAKKFMSIVGALTLTLGMVASLPASASINVRRGSRSLHNSASGHCFYG